MQYTGTVATVYDVLLKYLDIPPVQGLHSHQYLQHLGHLLITLVRLTLEINLSSQDGNPKTYIRNTQY